MTGKKAWRAIIVEWADGERTIVEERDITSLNKLVAVAGAASDLTKKVDLLRYLKERTKP